MELRMWTKKKRIKEVKRVVRVLWLALLFVGTWPAFEPLGIAGPDSKVMAQGNLGIVPDQEPYGKSDLWDNLKNDPQLKDSTDRVCKLAKIGLKVAAAMAVVAAFLNMIRAAKEGQGGRWRIVFVSLLLASFLVAPRTFFEMMGLDSLTQKGGMWSCVLKKAPATPIPPLPTS